MDRLYSNTKSVCPVCGSLVQSRIIETDNRIWLEKFCPRDGVSAVMVCSDPKWYRESRSYAKPGEEPLDRAVDSFAGCPDSCGLCPEHRQHTCLPVIEITSACNMDCPVCLKNLNKRNEMTVEEYGGLLERLLACEGKVPVVNLSGGEPTLHPQFAEILRLSASSKVMQTTVSTNGLLLHRDKSLRDLIRDTGAIVALQFDGFAAETYRRLRGVDLSEIKMETIHILEEERIRYSLTATVMKGVNDGEISAITDFFFRSRALSLMFQPVAFTGSAMALDADQWRLTIPDVVGEIEKSGFVKKGDFNPLPCSHYSCFALAYYLHLEGETYLSLKEFLGLEKYLDVIANRTLPGLDEKGYELIMQRIYEIWSAADSCADSEPVLNRIRGILRELSSTPFTPKCAFELGSSAMKGIFIHSFMDRETLDVGRLMKCCNHYAQADGRLIPICAENVFFQGSPG